MPPEEPRHADSLPVDAGDSPDSRIRNAVPLSEPTTAVVQTGARLLAGDVVGGRFRIEHLANSGGMGTVYRALDLMGQVPVALKVVARARRETHAARFAREANVLAELSHPAIVHYVVRGELADGRPFLAMEWLDGEDLSVHLARSPLSAADAVSLVKRAAEGLAVAHARGVVHRDVKPSNLFLVGGDPGRVKVVDFGIARLLGSELGPTARELTATGAVVGTVGYMSPEQAVGSRELDARSDVFALGCVLFECLTGRPAFSGSRVVAVLAKVLRDEAPRLRDVRPELGASLDKCVARMLAKEPADRPARIGSRGGVRDVARIGSRCRPRARRRVVGRGGRD